MRVSCRPLAAAWDLPRNTKGPDEVGVCAISAEPQGDSPRYRVRRRGEVACVLVLAQVHDARQPWKEGRLSGGGGDGEHREKHWACTKCVSQKVGTACNAVFGHAVVPDDAVTRFPVPGGDYRANLTTASHIGLWSCPRFGQSSHSSMSGNQQVTLHRDSSCWPPPPPSRALSN